MKLSNILLLSFFGLVAIGGISFMVMVKSELQNYVAQEPIEVETYSKDVALDAFSSIVHSENMELEITSGNAHAMKITSTNEEDLAFDIETSITDSVLTLSFGNNGSFGSKHIRLEVSTPKVNHIQLNQQARCILQDFQQDSLAITFEDDARVNLEGALLDYIKLIGSGDGAITIHDAGKGKFDVFLSDNAIADINDLSGAYVSGEVRNESLLNLQGSVNNMSIAVDESARLIKAD